MEQQTGSKLRKEYVKAVYCHPDYLTYMQSTSYPVACGILVLETGIKPMSPALAGGFLSTEPPGKS